LDLTTFIKPNIFQKLILKNMPFISIYTILFAFSISTFQSKELPNQLNDFDLKIYQGDNIIAVTASEQSIDLVKEKFTINFKIKKDDEAGQNYHAARLITDIDPDIFKQFEVRKNFEEIPSLSEGTSIAGPKDSQYECIFFGDQSHHYIFYNNEEEKRATLISKEENGFVQLSIDIENYCLQDLEVNIKNTNFEKLYFVFFIDENLNQKIDEGEFVKLIINFN
jgi:hypothetical protein